MDKLSLNNQVVLMRKQVKQAKLHIIRKLTRRQKILKSKKGSDEEKRKNLQKAERLLEEIQQIKRLEVDRISKFALSNTKNFAEVIKETTPASDLRPLARIAEHKVVSNSVSSFRKKFPKWEKELPILMSMWEIRKKFKQSDSKKRPNKPNYISVADKRIETDKKENLLKRISKDSNRIKVAKQSTISVNKSKLESNENLNNTSDEESDEERTHTVEIDAQKVKQFTEEYVSQMTDKKYGEKEIKKINLTNVDIDFPDTKMRSGFSLKSRDLETVRKHQKQKDDFFISENQTDVDEGDGSVNNTWDNQSVSSENDSAHFKKSLFSVEKLRNFKSAKHQKRNSTSFEKPIKQKSKFGSWDRKSAANTVKDRKNFKGMYEDRKDQSFNKNTQHLHPSWEAKKKLQEQQKQLFAFQGKKIKFDE